MDDVASVLFCLAYFWILAFGVNLDGKHYDIGCGGQRGVVVTSESGPSK